MEILGNLNVSTNGLNNNTPAVEQLTNVNTVFLRTNIFGVCVCTTLRTSNAMLRSFLAVLALISRK